MNSESVIEIVSSLQRGLDSVMEKINKYESTKEQIRQTEARLQELQEQYKREKESLQTSQ